MSFGGLLVLGFLWWGLCRLLMVKEDSGEDGLSMVINGGGLYNERKALKGSWCFVGKKRGKRW